MLRFTKIVFRCFLILSPLLLDVGARGVLCQQRGLGYSRETNLTKATLANSHEITPSLRRTSAEDYEIINHLGESYSVSDAITKITGKKALLVLADKMSFGDYNFLFPDS